MLHLLQMKGLFGGTMVENANLHLRKGQFGGTTVENANLHLRNFVDMCLSLETMNPNPDSIRLKLFSFSLADEATICLANLLQGPIMTCTNLEKVFRERYFPIFFAVGIQIASFWQNQEESLHEVWARFKRKLVMCPRH